MLTIKNNISCLIPAAGKGKRAGLDYPKTLFKLNSLPILIRILKSLSDIDSKPSVVINSKYHDMFIKILNKYNYQAELLFQKKQIGMGNSILQFNKSYKKFKNNNILLIWGDIPYIRKTTIKKLISLHFKNNNDFSLITKLVDNPYTIVTRDKNNKILSIKETKTNKGLKPKYGERDIGIFLFRRSLIMNFLKKKLPDKYQNGEHGFLYIIEHLICSGYKVEGYPIANNKEIISFNSLNDLK